jgi:hypothetical protein
MHIAGTWLAGGVASNAEPQTIKEIQQFTNQ